MISIELALHPDDRMDSLDFLKIFCTEVDSPGQRRCHECLLRPEGPTRHGNQEGRQVDQGDVDGEYPPWSAIFGSLRYMNLIEN
jgi:hypothetical protein